MFSRAHIVSTAAAAGFFLAAGTAARAQLAANSPFLPPASANVAAPTQNQPLEFRAMIELPEGVLYRIYDPAKKIGIWVKPNERNADFGVTVKQYDAGRKVLVVDHEGRTLTLPEREGKVISSGAMAQAMPAPMPMPMPAPNPAAPGQTAVVNPTPVEEQRRLEAVAAEVARRRAMREQATQPGVPNAPVQNVAPVQVQPPQNFQPNGQPNPANAGARGGPIQGARQQR